MSMLVIPPLDITPARLTATSAVEVAPAAYNPATTYALGNTASVAGAAGLIDVYKSLQASNTGHTPASSPTWWQNIGSTYQVYSGGATYSQGDRVINPSTHMQYESLVSGNTGNALTDETKWYDLGQTNPYAAFDLNRGTATTTPVTQTFSITPGVRTDAIAFAGIVATSITITETVAGNIVYSATEDLNTREVFNWYDYYFLPFGNKETISFFDLPPYSNGVISVSLSNTGGAVSLGACILGMQVNIGDVQAEAVSDVINYSTVDRPVGRPAKLNSIPNVPKNIQNIFVDKVFAPKIDNLRDSLAGKPAFWSGLQDSDDGFYQLIQRVGFYTTFSINMAHPDHAIISLEIQEI